MPLKVQCGAQRTQAKHKLSTEEKRKENNKESINLTRSWRKTENQK